MAVLMEMPLKTVPYFNCMQTRNVRRKQPFMMRQAMPKQPVSIRQAAED